MIHSHQSLCESHHSYLRRKPKFNFANKLEKSTFRRVKLWLLILSALFTETLHYPVTKPENNSKNQRLHFSCKKNKIPWYKIRIFVQVKNLDAKTQISKWGKSFPWCTHFISVYISRLKYLQSYPYLINISNFWIC